MRLRSFIFFVLMMTSFVNSTVLAENICVRLIRESAMGKRFAAAVGVLEVADQKKARVLTSFLTSTESVGEDVTHAAFSEAEKWKSEYENYPKRLEHLQKALRLYEDRRREFERVLSNNDIKFPFIFHLPGAPNVNEKGVVSLPIRRSATFKIENKKELVVQMAAEKQEMRYIVRSIAKEHYAQAARYWKVKRLYEILSNSAEKRADMKPEEISVDEEKINQFADSLKTFFSGSEEAQRFIPQPSYIERAKKTIAVDTNLNGYHPVRYLDFLIRAITSPGKTLMDVNTKSDRIKIPFKLVADVFIITAGLTVAGSALYHFGQWMVYDPVKLASMARAEKEKKETKLFLTDITSYTPTIREFNDKFMRFQVKISRDESIRIFREYIEGKRSGIYRDGTYEDPEIFNEAGEINTLYRTLILGGDVKIQDETIHVDGIGDRIDLREENTKGFDRMTTRAEQIGLKNILRSRQTDLPSQQTPTLLPAGD